MERWQNKIAIVTGSSGGIGASIVEKLVENGVEVVGLARRLDKLQELSKKLSNFAGKFHLRQCDITKEKEILETFKWIKENIGVVHILVNNAGVLKDGFLYNGKTEDWLEIFNTNVLGLSICTRESVQQMIANNIDGHIVHINSIAGHSVPLHNPPSSSVYPASKFAVTALAESLRQEMVWLKNKIKVTSISPGLTYTDMYHVGFAAKEDTPLPCLLPEDVANAVLYVLGTPAHVQVKELVIKPTGEDV